MLIEMELHARERHDRFQLEAAGRHQLKLADASWDPNRDPRPARRFSFGIRPLARAVAAWAMP